MSVCFYHDLGRMLGVDAHKIYPMLVFTDLFTIWPRTVWKETTTVTADSNEMVQEGYDLYLVPHIPPPEPKAVVEAGLATATSSSKPFLSRGTVHGQGAALACCSAACVGLNNNCWDAGLKSFPSGIVICPTSVVTTPSAADYASAIVGVVLSNLLSRAFAGFFKMGDIKGLPSVIVKHVIRRLPDLAKLADRLLGPVLGPILLGPLGVPSQAQRVSDKLKKAVRQLTDELLER